MSFGLRCLSIVVLGATACGRTLAESSDDVGDAAAGVDAGADAGADASTADATLEAGSTNSRSRIVFVTNAQVAADALGGDGADELCTAEAASSTSLQGKRFRAWLSTPSQAAKDRHVASDGAYERLDGVRVAQGFSQLAAGTLDAPINLDPTGKTWSTSGSKVWTGTTVNGAVASSTCEGWTTADPSKAGVYGELTEVGTTWTNAGAEPCDSTNHLYCIEQ